MSTGAVSARPPTGRAESVSTGADAVEHRRSVARTFTRMAACGELDLPLPGGGLTRTRWEALTRWAQADLSLARLAEGHADAAAILAELRALRVQGAQDLPSGGEGARWGVWAAEPPGYRLEARQVPGGWLLSGVKPFCSGARVCTHALVTAREGERRRLFAVEVRQRGVEPLPDSWPGAGMAGSDTLDVTFDDVRATPAGGPGAYPERPGFHHGGIGVAACWYGGARAVARTLLAASRTWELDPHALAHLGAVDARLATVEALLDSAAAAVDADPHDLDGAAGLRTMRVRAAVEQAAGEILTRVGRALGATPLGHDAVHSRAVADLTVYLRQHHAERDLAALGKAASATRLSWEDR
ncbi:acyl-CoA dehydrogenase [Kitasatospora herbaricolor]|uniref:acyl-CoA dehydrogenase family protein n=1 Tax=Kitasatospora herbaricolor TaxID=68217 RepID=UPI0019920215|nr:acyl-CoA dehydrogenase family protein [Kitasatospora herbaricolor]MDQ0306714.1 alkylation response protein AidB-like acyl-CoA dehydrogenase [Kitasatospora herbaricolor]GGV46555.1 acyl-CoA dehydrogenase [Kitasatospora herbaricolor]